MYPVADSKVKLGKLIFSRDRQRLYNYVAKSICKQQSIHYIDIFDTWEKEQTEDRSNLYIDDHIHLNPLGYQDVSKIVRDYLSSKGKEFFNCGSY